MQNIESISESMLEAVERVADKRHASAMKNGCSEKEAAAQIVEFLTAYKNQYPKSGAYAINYINHLIKGYLA